MKKVNVLMFVADCGRKYQSRGGCISHEKACKCFTNPKFRACHSCSFNGGLKKEDGERYRDCTHPNYEYDRMKKYEIPNTATSDCINCPLYQSKYHYTGCTEKWTGYGKGQTENTSYQITGDALPF